MTPGPRSLAALARALGGDCYAAGSRALVPAPGHSSLDRSVSLRLVEGRVLAHSFGAAGWRQVLDDLRSRGWIDAQNRLCAEGAASERRAGRPEPTRAERVRAAQRLWAAAGPIASSSPAGRHLRLRGVDLGLDGAGALRTCGATPLAIYRDRGPRLPALLAAVRDPTGELTAVEVTYLDGRGARSRLARPPRKIIGALPAGSAVRLAPAAEAMLVAEGVFTTLAAMARFRLPGWALLSTGNLRGWRPPPDVRRVLIAADRGPDGERSAKILRHALIAWGLGVELRFPPAGRGDWNDLAQAERREAAQARSRVGVGEGRREGL